MSAKDDIPTKERRFDTEKAPTSSKPAQNPGARLDISVPELFVVRVAPPSTAFACEVRMFGAIVIARGEGYSTEELAIPAGSGTLIAASTDE